MEQWLSLLDSTIRVATPLVLAALAGMFSERSGVVDIGLEGKMLVAAFASGAAAFVTHSPWLGLLAGVMAAVSMAMVHAFVSVTYNGNQLISGMAINTIASGITPVLAWPGSSKVAIRRSWMMTRAFTTSACRLPMPCRMCRSSASCTASCCPVTASWSTSPFSSSRGELGGIPQPLWPAPARGGRKPACGGYRWRVGSAGALYRLFWGGVLCGMAGTFLSVYQTGSFIKEMTAGKGFLALAALIFR
jgi:simple sugar transport system permease protein